MRPPTPGPGFAALAALAALALAACGGRADRPPCPAGKVCLEYGNTNDPTSLDPHKISLTAENTILGDLMVGLLEDGPDGRPVPGIATSWDTSGDGLVWTFHLRQALWSDGTPVTADDFVFAFRRILDPKTASPYAYLMYLLKNGEAVNAGKLAPAALGVRAPDARTVEVTLEHPAPYFPQIAKYLSMYPVPRHVVERYGDAWADPAHFVSDGPYVPVSWKLGDHVEVAKNPRFFDAAHVCVDRIDYYPTNDSVSAERRIKRGELDVNTSIQSNRVPYLRRPDQIPAYVHVARYIAVVYLAFNTHDVPALKDARVRQALSMAIDREFITGKLLRAGQTPAYAFLPPGIANYVADYKTGPHTPWADWPLERRQAEARRLLAQAGYGPAHPLSLDVTFPNTPDPMLYTPAIQNDWKSIGVKANLMLNETQIAFESYKTRDFQVGVASWAGDYNDPMTFLALMASGTGQQNYSDYSNPTYDGLLSRADHEVDVAARADDLARAEQIMLQDASVAPLYFTVSRNLVRPDITGWVDNITDTHRSRYLCVKGLR